MAQDLKIEPTTGFHRGRTDFCYIQSSGCMLYPDFGHKSVFSRISIRSERHILTIRLILQADIRGETDLCCHPEVQISWYPAKWHPAARYLCQSTFHIRAFRSISRPNSFKPQPLGSGGLGDRVGILCDNGRRWSALC